MTHSVKPQTAIAPPYYVAMMDPRRKPLQEIVRENLSRLKNVIDLSEQRIARRGGTSQRTVNRLLNAKNATLESLDRVATAVRMPPWQLCVPDLDLTNVAREPEAHYSADETSKALALYRKYANAGQAAREAVDILLNHRPRK